MLGLLAAALLAPAPAPAAPTSTPSPVLESSQPWWEKITVTVDHQGTQQGCRYETNLKGAAACDEALAASIKASGKGRTGTFSKVTFERRFTPGARPDAAAVHPGDTLLGRQVMYLTFDAKGLIDSCKVVSVTGDTPPDYGCDGARKEQFRAGAGAGAATRQAFMTISAYGHTEQIA